MVGGLRHGAGEGRVTEAHCRAVLEVDQVLAFFASPEGQKLFGAEKAAEMAQHMREVKAAGGKYCDCPACAPGREILDHKDSLL